MPFAIIVNQISTKKETQPLVSQTLTSVQLMTTLFVKIVMQITTKAWEDQLVSLTLTNAKPTLLSTKENVKLVILTGILKTELFVIQTSKNVQNMKPQDQNVRLVLPRPERPMTDFTATISSQNVRPMF